MGTLTIKESVDSKLERLANIMTITELSGRKRTITLSSSSMPKKGANWGLEQRMKTTFSPGNIEGTQQVVGPIPLESNFSGVWRRTKLGRNPLTVEEGGSETNIIQPATACALFEDVVAGGALLQVVWNSIVRTGRIKRFNAPHDTKFDVNWEMSFNWISFGPTYATRLVLTRSGGGSASQIDGMLLDSEALNVLDGASISVDPKKPKSSGAPSLTIGQVSAFLDMPNKLMTGFARQARKITNQLKAVADLGTKFKQQPALVTNTFLATCEDIVSVANQFQDEFSRDPPECRSYDSRVASLVNTTRYYAEGNRLADSIKNRASAMKDEQSRRAEAQHEGSTGDILALHLVKEGDTLMKISLKYYGTPDNGPIIAKANGIKYPAPAADTSSGSAKIADKTLLVIPIVRK